MTRFGELNIARRDLLKGSGALFITMNVPAAALFGMSETEARHPAISPAARLTARMIDM